MVKDVADEVGLLDHLRAVVAGARPLELNGPTFAYAILTARNCWRHCRRRATRSGLDPRPQPQIPSNYGVARMQFIVSVFLNPGKAKPRCLPHSITSCVPSALALADQRRRSAKTAPVPQPVR
jgi:hypothetical protein